MKKRWDISGNNTFTSISDDMLIDQDGNLHRVLNDRMAINIDSGEIESISTFDNDLDDDLFGSNNDEIFSIDDGNNEMF